MPDNIGQNRPIAGILTRLTAVFSLAIMFTFVKLAGENGVYVIESLFYRQLAALPPVCLLIWRSRDGWQAVTSSRHKLQFLRAFLGITAMGLNFWAYQLLPLADATTIGFSVPIFATLFAALILRESVGYMRWAAVIVGFIGVLVVIQPGGEEIAKLGTIVALTGALITAAVTSVIRVLGRTEPSIITIFWFSAYTFPPLAICTYFLEQSTTQKHGVIFLVSVFSEHSANLQLHNHYDLLRFQQLFRWIILHLYGRQYLVFLFFGQWPGISIWLGAPVIIGSGLLIAWREQIRANRSINEN